MKFDAIKKIGLIAVIAVLAVGLIAASPALAENQIYDEYPTEEELKEKNVYLHNETFEEDAMTMNTTMGEQQYMTDWTFDEVRNDWYLDPAFAGDFRLEGETTIYTWIDISDVEGHTNVLDLHMYLYEDDSDEHFAHGHEQYDEARTIFNEYSVSTDIDGHNISAGSRLRVEFVIEASDNYRKRLAFGDSEFPSRLEISTPTYIDTETLTPRDSDYEERYTFPIDPEDEETIIHFNASITDPFGGYDVRGVYITVENPEETIFYREDMSLMEGDDTSYRLNYTYTWDYSGMPEGEYTVRVSAVDNTGYNYRYPDNPGDETYGGHLQSLEETIWIGAERYHVNLRTIDSLNETMQGAEVQVLRTIEDDIIVDNEGLTDEEGITNLSMRGGENLVRVHWQDVVVFNETVDVYEDVPREELLNLSCEVYTPTYRVVDVANEPIENVNLHIAHPNGTTLRRITRDNGEVEVPQLPTGEYSVRSEWLTKVVNETTHGLDSNEMVEIKASVHYLEVQVHDEREEPVSDVHLTFRYDDTDRVADADLTDMNGETKMRLPETIDFNYQVIARWRGVSVGETRDIELADNDSVSIQLEIYYVDVQVVDSTPEGEPLGGARIRLYNEVTGALANSDVVDPDGYGEVRLPSGDHSVEVYWNGIDVTPQDHTIDVEEGMDLQTVEAQVYSMVINVEDVEGETVENSDITIRHSELSEGRDLIAEVNTGEDGTVILRLPRGEQNLTVRWRNVIVEEEILNVEGNDELTLTTEIYHLDLEVIDDRGLPIEGAEVTVTYTNGDLYLSRRTDSAGIIDERMPAAAWNVEVNWRDTEIYSGSFEVSEEEDSIELQSGVYYLTVITEDGDEVKLSDVHVEVFNEEFKRSGYTENGSVTFRLPARDDYVIEAEYESTYMLTEVEVNETETMILEATSEETMTFEDYPIPFYRTNLFMFIGLLIIVIAAIIFAYTKKTGVQVDEEEIEEESEEDEFNEEEEFEEESADEGPEEELPE